MSMVAIKGFEGRYNYDTEKNQVFSLVSGQYLKWYGPGNDTVKLTRKTNDPYPVSIKQANVERLVVNGPSGCRDVFNSAVIEHSKARSFIVVGEADLQIIDDYFVYNSLKEARTFAEELVISCGGRFLVLEILGSVRDAGVVWEDR